MPDSPGRAPCGDCGYRPPGYACKLALPTSSEPAAPSPRERGQRLGGVPADRDPRATGSLRWRTTRPWQSSTSSAPSSPSSAVMQALKRSCGRKSRADAPFRSSADYVDREIPLLHRMFEKRLRGYRAIGYARDSVPAGYEEANTEPVQALPDHRGHVLPPRGQRRRVIELPGGRRPDLVIDRHDEAQGFGMPWTMHQRGFRQRALSPGLSRPAHPRAARRPPQPIATSWPALRFVQESKLRSQPSSLSYSAWLPIQNQTRPSSTSTARARCRLPTRTDQTCSVFLNRRARCRGSCLRRSKA